jgi:hypothetical protein
MNATAQVVASGIFLGSLGAGWYFTQKHEDKVLERSGLTNDNNHIRSVIVDVKPHTNFYYGGVLMTNENGHIVPFHTNAAP